MKDIGAAGNVVIEVAQVVQNEIQKAGQGGEKLIVYTKTKEICDWIEGALPLMAVGAECFWYQ